MDRAADESVDLTTYGTPAQGGHLANACPERVQLDVLRPCEPLPEIPFMRMLSDAGIAFQQTVFERLRTSVSGAALIDHRLSRDRREHLTTQAMCSGVPLIIGGRLPTDAAGHRVGEPDVLLRLGEGVKADARWTYAAVEVKNYHVANKSDKPGVEIPIVIGAPDWSGPGAPPVAESVRWRYADLMQLAHYQRMLEACGHQAERGNWAGIIGSEGQLAWYDLDVPTWHASSYIDDLPPRKLSSLEAYDVEFTHRLAVLAAALIHMDDRASALLAVPILIAACPSCPWRGWCFERLEKVGDLSLLVSPARRRQHHDRDVTDLRLLASLDHRTARVLSAGVDVAYLAQRIAGDGPTTPIADVIPQRPKQIELLAREGVHTMGDVKSLCTRTLRYEDAGMGDLPMQIDRARARLGEHPAYRRREVDELSVPRGAVEIDVDMENIAEGCYLWGVLVAERDSDGFVEAEYKAFVTWDPTVTDGELDAFARFWCWLSDLRREVASAGQTLRAYCYSKGAENGQMRRIAGRLGIEPEVEVFLQSEQWIDLHEVLSRQLVTGRSMGLKTAAHLAGFGWHGDEAGGGQAMVRYAQVVSDDDPEIRAVARRWLLEYNEDDVRATAALRDWLDGDARLLPSVGDLGP